MTLIGFVPIVGTAISTAYFVYQDYQRDDYGMMAFDLATAFPGGKFLKGLKFGKWLGRGASLADDLPPVRPPGVRNADEAFDLLRNSPTGRITVQAAEDIPVYRVYGGASPLGGRSWSTVDPRLFSQTSYRIKAGLPDENLASLLAIGKIRRGTVFELERASELYSPGMGMWLAGGLPEVNARFVTMEKARLPMFWAGVL